MKQLNIEQGSPEWHELRKNHIGSSDAPIIMNGEHFGKTPYKLWEEKLGLRLQEKENWGMSMGTKYEPIARSLMQDKLGMELLPATLKSDESIFAMASVDCISTDGKTVGEIKWPDEEAHMVAVKGMVPCKYLAQLQHIMYVTEVDSIMYSSNWFNKEKELFTVYVKLERDEPYIKKLLDKEAEFWECKQSFVAPPLNDKDFVQRSDSVWQLHAETILEIERELERLEIQKEYCRKKLIEMANGRNCEGSGIRLNRIIRKGSVDYGKVPMLQGVDLDPYRKSYSESWRITKK